MRALVVDDSALVVQRVSDTLHSLGYETIGAANGQEAYSAFVANACDIVVADIIMPVCDGIELTRRIRSVNRDVPIVLLTSAGDAHYVQQARDAGANAYLLKPLDEALLRECVESLLQPALAALADGTF